MTDSSSRRAGTPALNFNGRSGSAGDPVGGGTTQFVIPTFTPAGAGSISWRVEIFDDNPDVDVAAGTTNVNP